MEEAEPGHGRLREMAVPDGRLKLGIHFAEGVELTNHDGGEMKVGDKSAFVRPSRLRRSGPFVKG